MHLTISAGLIAGLIALPAALAAPTGPVATGLAHVVKLPEDSTAFSGSLEKRAVSCTTTAACSGLTGVPYAAHPYCNPSTKTCTWLCNSGYTKSAGKCVKNLNTPRPASATVPPTITVKTTTKTTTTTPHATATDWLVNAEIAKNGITGFNAATLGVNTNAIASWFHTNSATDSTNGNSWCLYPYDDTVPGMAISLAQMRANYGNNDDLAREAYCGLEAVITTPTGTHTLYVTDAFDDAWVRTPSSLDVVYGSFAALFGRVTNDKNDVVVGASWKFTGRRNYKYKARGRGSSK